MGNNSGFSSSDYKIGGTAEAAHYIRVVPADYTLHPDSVFFIDPATRTLEVRADKRDVVAKALQRAARDAALNLYRRKFGCYVGLLRFEIEIASIKVRKAIIQVCSHFLRVFAQRLRDL